MDDLRFDDRPPEGFVLIEQSMGGFDAVAGPFYMMLKDDEGILGMRVKARHLNRMGNCHGGVVATLADNQAHVAQFLAREERGVALTIHLAVDYVAPTPEGAWLEMKARLLRRTKNLLFCDACIFADGTLVGRSSAIYKLVEN